MVNFKVLWVMFLLLAGILLGMGFMVAVAQAADSEMDPASGSASAGPGRGGIGEPFSLCCRTGPHI